MSRHNTRGMTEDELVALTAGRLPLDEWVPQFTAESLAKLLWLMLGSARETVYLDSNDILKVARPEVARALLGLTESRAKTVAQHMSEAYFDKVRSRLSRLVRNEELVRLTARVLALRGESEVDGIDLERLDADYFGSTEMPAHNITADEYFKRYHAIGERAQVVLAAIPIEARREFGVAIAALLTTLHTPDELQQVLSLLAVAALKPQ